MRQRTQRCHQPRHANHLSNAADGIVRLWHLDAISAPQPGLYVIIRPASGPRRDHVRFWPIRDIAAPLTGAGMQAIVADATASAASGFGYCPRAIANRGYEGR